MKDDSQEKHIEELEDVAVFGGSKLGVLVAGLPVGNDVKASLLNLIENADDVKQLQRLEVGLESLYFDAKTRGVDKQLLEELENLKFEIEEEEDKAEDEFLARLNIVEDRVNSYDL